MSAATRSPRTVRRPGTELRSSPGSGSKIPPPASALRVLGAEVVGRSVVFRAQNPVPDAPRSVSWRPVAPTGGALRFVVGGRTHTASYDPRLRGWVAPAGSLRAGAQAVVPAGGLVDGLGNRSGEAVTVVVGKVATAEWPTHLGTGGGRTPGPFGEGTWPP